MMTSANALRLMAATAIPLALAGCDTGAGSAQASKAAGGPAKQAPTGLAPARTGYASVEGGRIYYQVYGDLGSGKTPLLALHGSFMSGDATLPLFEPYIASRPVIAIDARGHGRSGHTPGRLTYEAMADDAAAVLAGLEVASADVMGYSMGATTALFMAIRHPERVGKQVILAGPSRRDGWYPEVLQAMAQGTAAQFVGSPVETEYRRLSPTPDKFSTFVEEVLGLEKQDYRASDESVRGIKGETMIVVGDADGVSLEHAVELFKLRGGGDRQAAAQGMIQGTPRARLAILPATSHVGLMAEAERIAELVTPFLDDQGPKRLTGFFEGMDAAEAPAGSGGH